MFNKDEVKSYRKIADVFAEMSAPKARAWKRREPVADGESEATSDTTTGYVALFITHFDIYAVCIESKFSIQKLIFLSVL